MMSSSESSHQAHHTRIARSSRLTERRTSLSPIYDTAVATNSHEASPTQVGDKVNAKHGSSMLDDVDVKNPSKNEVLIDDNENYMYDSYYEEDFEESFRLNRNKQLPKQTMVNSYEDSSQKFENKLPDLQYSSTCMASSSDKDQFFVIGHKMDVPKESTAEKTQKAATTNLLQTKTNKFSSQASEQTTSESHKTSKLPTILNESRANKQAVVAAPGNNPSKFRNNHFENTYYTRSLVKLSNERRKSIDENPDNKEKDLKSSLIIISNESSTSNHQAVKKIKPKLNNHSNYINLFALKDMTENSSSINQSNYGFVNMLSRTATNGINVNNNYFSSVRSELKQFQQLNKWHSIKNSLNKENNLNEISLTNHCSALNNNGEVNAFETVNYLPDDERLREIKKASRLKPIKMTNPKPTKQMMAPSTKEEQAKRHRKRLEPIESSQSVSTLAAASTSDQAKILENASPEKLNNAITESLNSFGSPEEGQKTLKIGRLARPEMTRARLKPKTPIKYDSDKKIRDLKTPTFIRSGAIGRWSPIRINVKRSFRLFEKIKLDSFERERELEREFDRLDDDEDGHVEFEKLDARYLGQFNQAQKSFLFQIYDILSESTYFGLKEFISFYLLVEHFKQFDHKKFGFYWEYFASTDFQDYKAEIKDLLTLLDKINLESNSQRLVEIIKIHLNSTTNKISIENDRLIKNFNAFMSEGSKYQHGSSGSSLTSNKQNIYRCLNCTLDMVPATHSSAENRENTKRAPNSTETLEINSKNTQTSVLTKSLNFIILIPFLLYIETTQIRNESLFQRKQNTILNMKDARNFHNFNKKSSLHT